MTKEVSVQSGRPLRIGIDAHVLGRKKGGVETYVYNLIRALARIDGHNEYIVYTGRNHTLDVAGLGSNFRIRLLPIVNPWLQRSLVIPIAYLQDRLDVIYLQRAMPPWGCHNTALHIHDVQYMTHPDLFPAWKRPLLNAAMKMSARRAYAIFTGTFTTREEILRHLGADSSKIVLVPCAVDAETTYPIDNRSAASAACSRLGVAGKFVLFLGAIDRNKNIHVLLESFSRFRSKFPEWHLVIAGQERKETGGGYGAFLRNLADELGCSGKTIFTGYISDHDRNLLLNAASMLVFPSVAEGFGIPPLEAMSCGIPVITSNLPVMRETYEGSALFVDPGDAEGFATAMESLVRNPDLVDKLVEKGYQTARRYSWDGIAGVILQTLEQSADRPLVYRAGSTNLGG